MLSKLKAYLLGQKLDLGHGKERQISTKLIGIRNDHKARYDLVKKRIESTKIYSKILDCASGIGYGSYMLSKSKYVLNIDAVDKNKEAHSFGAKYYPSKKIKRLNINLNKLRKENNDSKYDFITCFETLEHLEDIEAKEFLLSLHLLLKSEGKLFISTPNEDLLPFAPEKFLFHKRHYTVQEFENLLLDSGFNIENFFSQKSKFSRHIQENTNGIFLIAEVTK